MNLNTMPRAVNPKLGISLIAVLMFMLAATTASIVVFKMLSSENFASGSRLKMSESEAAANSGLDAIRAWLENKAPEAGILLSDYLSERNISNGQPNPMFIDNAILGNVGGNKRQDYKVYLIGADVSGNVYKLKFASIGEARDNSRNTQIAVFGVEGLYRLLVPARYQRAPFNQAFYGSAGDLTGNPEFSSAIINGNASGNMPKITESLVVTGNATFKGGTSLTCDGNSSGDLYIVGNLKPTNDLKVCGNAYVGSLDFDGGADGTFEKDIYINGDASSSILKEFSVGQNLTTNGGTLTINSNYTTKIGGDFAMLNNSKLVFNGSNANPQLTVEGTSWIPKGDISLNQNNRVALNNNSDKNLYVGGTIYDRGTNNGYNLYSKIQNGNTFRSKSLNATSIPDSIPPEDVSLASDLYNEIGWRVEAGGGSVEDPIQMMNVDEWIKRAIDIAAKCSFIKGLNNRQIQLNGTDGGDFSNDLNACYNNLSENELYKGYLPILVNNNGTKDLSKDPALNGNFFLIFTGSTQFTLPKTGTNPKTGKDAYIMAYFLDNNHSVNYGGVTVNGTSSQQGTLTFPSNRSNIFIYSERDISEVNGAQFNGSIFMANGKTVSKFQGELKIEFNEDLYNSLVAAGILELTEAGRKVAEANENFLGDDKPDYRYTALAPRLKVSLESRNISTETLNNLNENNRLQPAVLVMPRIIYVPKDAALGSTNHWFDNYFSVLYLNNATSNTNRNNSDWRTSRGITRDCKNMTNNNSVSFDTGLEEGDYICAFVTTGEAALIDSFFVRVSGDLGSAKVGFSGSGSVITDDTPETGGLKCTTVRLQYVAGTDPSQTCDQVSISTTNLSDGWTIRSNNSEVTPSVNIPNASLSGISVNSTESYSFDVCTGSSVATGTVTFQIINFGGSGGSICGAGTNTAYTVSREGDVIAEITRIRNSELDYRPDCDGYSLANPAKSTSAWGAFQVNSTASCSAGEEKYEYSCKATNSYDVSLQLASSFILTDECEFLPSNPTPGRTVSSDESVRIEADIKRKEYNLEIFSEQNLTVTLTPSTNICINMEDGCTENLSAIVCPSTDNCQEMKIYAGVTYNVSISGGGVLVNMGNGLNGDGFTGYGLEGRLWVNDYDNRENRFLNLSVLPNPSAYCKLKNGAEMVVVEPLLSNEAIEITLMDTTAYVKNNQGRCEDEIVIYTVSGNGLPSDQKLTEWTYPVKGNNYTLSASITCKQDNNVDGAVSSVGKVDCEGTFNVVDERIPELSCAWGNDSYHVGNTPSVNVTVTKGNVKTCGEPSISNGYNIDVTSWGNPIKLENSTESIQYYTITANSAIRTTGENRYVKIQATCGSEVIEKECPVITVGEAPPCEVSSNFSNICPNTLWPNEVKWNQSPGDNSYNVGCYYISSATTFNSDNYRVNGVAKSGYINSGFPDKIDNGYYIYISSKQNYFDLDNLIRGTKPECVPPDEPELTCSWTGAGNQNTGWFVGELNKVENGPIPIPEVSCGGTAVVGDVIWSTMPFGDNVYPASYEHITAKVAAGVCGTTSKEADCGSLRVRYAPRIKDCDFATNISGEASLSLTKPSIKLTDESYLCSNDKETPNTDWSNEIWKYGSSNGGTFNWASLPTSANYPTTYSNFSVSGNCGEYGTVPERTCSGSVEVNEPRGTLITIPTGGGGSGINITTSGLYVFKCTDTSKSVDCNRNSSTTLEFVIDEVSIKSSNNSPVTVMNPCKDGTLVEVILGNGGTATCNNRGGYW